MNIIIIVKNVWGTPRMYIQDPVIAQGVTELTQRKTVTQADLEALKKLGYTYQISDSTKELM